MRTRPNPSERRYTRSYGRSTRVPGRQSGLLPAAGLIYVHVFTRSGGKGTGAAVVSHLLGNAHSVPIGRDRLVRRVSDMARGT